MTEWWAAEKDLFEIWYTDTEILQSEKKKKENESPGRKEGFEVRTEVHWESIEKLQ